MFTVSGFLMPIKRYYRIAALALMVCLIGCGEDYGRLQRADDITESFKQLQVPDRLDYYYYGVNNRYYAIVGIDPIYQIPSEAWQPIDQKTPRFHRMVVQIWEDLDLTPYGARILDPQGHRIGIWYSSLLQVTVKFEAGDQISLMPDPAFLRGP